MARKYALYRIARWLRENRQRLSKLPLAEVKNRMIKEGLGRAAATGSPRQPQR